MKVVHLCRVKNVRFEFLLEGVGWEGFWVLGELSSSPFPFGSQNKGYLNAASLVRREEGNSY